MPSPIFCGSDTVISMKKSEFSSVETSSIALLPTSGWKFIIFIFIFHNPNAESNYFFQLKRNLRKCYRRFTHSRNTSFQPFFSMKTPPKYSLWQSFRLKNDISHLNDSSNIIHMNWHILSHFTVYVALNLLHFSQSWQLIDWFGRFRQNIAHSILFINWFRYRIHSWYVPVPALGQRQ